VKQRMPADLYAMLRIFHPVGKSSRKPGADDIGGATQGIAPQQTRGILISYATTLHRAPNHT